MAPDRGTSGETSRKLGIVAGGGPLPRRIVDRCLADGRPFFVFAIRGAAQEGLYDDVPHCWIRLGAAGEYLPRAEREGIQDLVMVGPVKRPSLVAMRPDATALKVLTRIGAKALGDDGLLRAVIEYFETEHGWRVVGIERLLTDMSPEPGQLGRHAPDAVAQSDIERARTVLSAIAARRCGPTGRRWVRERSRTRATPACAASRSRPAARCWSTASGWWRSRTRPACSSSRFRAWTRDGRNERDAGRVPRYGSR